MQQSPPSPINVTEPPSALADASAGDDVMKILADVEGQLSRLRAAQKTQDDAIVSLADRARLLRTAEDENEKSRRDIAQQQKALAQEREQLHSQRVALETLTRQTEDQVRAQQDEAARSRAVLDQQQATIASQGEEIRKRQNEFEHSQRNWEQQRALHEAELNKRHAELEQRAADLTRRQTDIDKERERIEALTKQCQDQQKQLEGRARQMETEHADLLRRVEQAEKNVGELISKLECSQQELSQRTEQHKQVSQEASQFRTRAATLENSLHQATERADRLERDSVELARLADREREAVEKKLAGATSQLEETRKTRDVATKDLSAALERVSTLEKQVKSLQTQLAERSARLTDSQEKLDLAGRKLSEFAKVLSEQTPQLERGAAAVAMVQEQQEQIDRLTKQLAEHTLRSDPEEMNRRDERIAQLTEALRQARGQAAGQQGIAELERRNAELTDEVSRLKLDLENAQVVAEDTKRQLEERADAQGSNAVQDATIAEHAAKVAALTAEIQQLHARAAADLKSKLETQARKHKKEFAEAHHSEAAELKSLRKRIAELQKELQDVRSAATESTVVDEKQFSQKLRDRAERITGVAEHLRRRRTRLEKYRMLVSRRAMQADSTPHTRMRAEESIELDKQRLELAELRHSLEASERRMVRKWAGHRAALTVFCLALLATMCAGASWLIADHYAPAVVSATVTLDAKTPQRAPLSPEAAAEWRTWHTAMLTDPTFHQALSKRLTEHRLDQFANPARLAQRLSNDLTVDAATEGKLAITLAGKDSAEITTVLDVLASTLAMESTRQAATRIDNAPAAVSGERHEQGRVRYAQLNSVPIQDDRVTYATVIFGALLTTCLLLLGVTYVKLSKVKRVFEQGDDIIALS